MRFLSDRACRWIRRLLEKFLKRFYEGEEAPGRLGDMAILWANENELATRGEWLSMAIHLAEEAYESGFARGVEYVERDPEFFDDLKPDLIADAADPGWQESPAITLDADPDGIVPPDEELEIEDLAVDAQEIEPDAYDDDRGHSFVDP